MFIQIFQVKINSDEFSNLSNLSLVSNTSVIDLLILTEILYYLYLNIQWFMV